MFVHCPNISISFRSLSKSDLDVLSNTSIYLMTPIVAAIHFCLLYPLFRLLLVLRSLCKYINTSGSIPCQARRFTCIACAQWWWLGKYETTVIGGSAERRWGEHEYEPHSLSLQWSPPSITTINCGHLHIGRGVLHHSMYIISSLIYVVQAGKSFPNNTISFNLIVIHDGTCVRFMMACRKGRRRGGISFILRGVSLFSVLTGKTTKNKLFINANTKYCVWTWTFSETVSANLLILVNLFETQNGW